MDCGPFTVCYIALALNSNYLLWRWQADANTNTSYKGD